MPYRRRQLIRRKPKRKYRKKYAKKSGSINRATLAVPFPNRMRTKLHYNSRTQLNPGNLTFSYTFNMNSLYDPDQTGVGTQPMFFDNLKVMYARYRVRGFKYNITVSNLNTPVRLVALPYNNAPPISVTQAAETPMAKTYIINAMSNGGRCIQKISGYVSIKKLLGENLDDDRDQANNDASPSNLARFMLYGETLDGATSISSVNLCYNLTFYSELFDRIPVTGS